MKSTLEQCLMAGLAARGEKLVKTTSRFRVFTRMKSLAGSVPTDGQTFFYVGSSGALRCGSTAGNSRPVMKAMKDKLVAEGRETLAQTNAARRQGAVHGQ